MAKKVQLMTNPKQWQVVDGVEVLVDVPQEDIDPVVDSSCVKIEGHRTLEETISQDNMFTPEIIHKFVFVFLCTFSVEFAHTLARSAGRSAAPGCTGGPWPGPVWLRCVPCAAWGVVCPGLARSRRTRGGGYGCRGGRG